MQNYQGYRLAIRAVREVRPLLEKIERRNRGLAKQLSEALASVPLNVAEGSRARGGNRVARYDTAMGSARETVACLETAEALGYLSVSELAAPVDVLDHVVAILWKSCR